MPNEITIHLITTLVDKKVDAQTRLKTILELVKASEIFEGLGLIISTIDHKYYSSEKNHSYFACYPLDLCDNLQEFQPLFENFIEQNYLDNDEKKKIFSELLSRYHKNNEIFDYLLLIFHGNRQILDLNCINIGFSWVINRDNVSLALHKTLRTNNIRNAKKLLIHGADPEAKDIELTTLEIAKKIDAKNGDKSALRLIKSAMKLKAALSYLEQGNHVLFTNKFASAVNYDADFIVEYLKQHVEWAISQQLENSKDENNYRYLLTCIKCFAILYADKKESSAYSIFQNDVLLMLRQYNVEQDAGENERDVSILLFKNAEEKAEFFKNTDIKIIFENSSCVKTIETMNSPVNKEINSQQNYDSPSNSSLRFFQGHMTEEEKIADGSLDTGVLLRNL